MSTPYEQKYKSLKATHTELRGYARRCQEAEAEMRDKAYEYRSRLIKTEEFLVSEGYRRVSLEGNTISGPSLNTTGGTYPPPEAYGSPSDATPTTTLTHPAV